MQFETNNRNNYCYNNNSTVNNIVDNYNNCNSNNIGEHVLHGEQQATMNKEGGATINAGGNIELVFPEAFGPELLQKHSINSLIESRQHFLDASATRLNGGKIAELNLPDISMGSILPTTLTSSSSLSSTSSVSSTIKGETMQLFFVK